MDALAVDDLALPRALPMNSCPSMYDRVEAHDLGPMEHTCPHCDAVHWLAERVTNSSEAKPRWQLCCQDGEVHLPPVSLLWHLFEDHPFDGTTLRWLSRH